MDHTPITYEWLESQGFHYIEKGERQPHAHVRRCLGMETIGEKFMTAPEDLCLDICPSDATETKWMCWITRSEAAHRQPTRWIHIRTLHWCEELTLLYEGLTGRRLGPKAWTAKDLEPPIFTQPAQDSH